MVNGIIGRKIGMTQVFEESGEVVPVTVIEAGPCPIVQLKTQERDGYQAVSWDSENGKRTGRTGRDRDISRRPTLNRPGCYANSE